MNVKRIIDDKTYDTATSIEIGRGMHSCEMRGQHVTAWLFRTPGGAHFVIEQTDQFSAGCSQPRTSREWFVPRDAADLRRLVEDCGIELMLDIEGMPPEAGPPPSALAAEPKAQITRVVIARA